MKVFSKIISILVHKFDESIILDFSVALKNLILKFSFKYFLFQIVKEFQCVKDFEQGVL